MEKKRNKCNALWLLDHEPLPTDHFNMDKTNDNAKRVILLLT